MWRRPVAATSRPTLPAALRTMFGLPASPPAGCLDAIFDPRRTMLGPVQLAAFEQALLNSSATFKLVVNEVESVDPWRAERLPAAFR